LSSKTRYESSNTLHWACSTSSHHFLGMSGYMESSCASAAVGMSTCNWHQKRHLGVAECSVSNGLMATLLGQNCGRSRPLGPFNATHSA